MKVSIFTTNTCAYCVQLKKYLTMKGVDYKEINVDDYPKFRQTAYELSGALTVPVTLIEKDNKKEVIVGFNLAKLAPLVS